MSSGQTNEFENMASDTYYPSSTGIVLGGPNTTLATTYPICPMHINLAIAGTVGGGSPAYQIEIQDQNGVWGANPDLLLNAAGVVSGYAVGHAVRLNAANGSAPGTGANTPRYALTTEVLNLRSTGRDAA